MSEINSDDAFLSLSQHVRKNIKTGDEELEVVLFDVEATSEDDSVVVITAKDYEIKRRVGQSHEIDRAKTQIKGHLKGSWIDELANED